MKKRKRPWKRSNWTHTLQAILSLRDSDFLKHTIQGVVLVYYKVLLTPAATRPLIWAISASKTALCSSAICRQ